MSAVVSRIRSIINRLTAYSGTRSVVFEVTQDCNQDCAFCYNVWKCTDYPRGQLDTQRTKDLLDRIIRDYKPRILTFTGGEPLLRSDLLELIRHASKHVKCNMISNGTLVDDTVARELVESGIQTIEFTLLSADRDIHNALVRRDSF